MCDDLEPGGEQIQLTDSRDGKTYWGELTDGNCWMTQNLDFDITAGEILTPNDTNIPSNWTPSVGTTTNRVLLLLAILELLSLLNPSVPKAGLCRVKPNLRLSWILACLVITL